MAFQSYFCSSGSVAASFCHLLLAAVINAAAAASGAAAATRHRMLLNDREPATSTAGLQINVWPLGQNICEVQPRLREAVARDAEDS